MQEMFNRGNQDALVTLGLVKTAVRVMYRPSNFKRFKDWATKKMPTWSGTKRNLIGSPTRFAEEVASGRALSKGSLIRDSLKAPSTMEKIMFLGFPAVESGGVLLDDEGDKARRIGESVGGSVLGMAAFRPVGMVGSMFADSAGRSIGGAIGQTAGHLTNKALGQPAAPSRTKGLLTPTAPHPLLRNLGATNPTQPNSGQYPQI